MTLPRDLRRAFCARPADADKRSVGVVAIIGGSLQFPHAPVIAALGARAAGAGLVHLAVPDASRHAAGALVPEATVARLSGKVSTARCDVAVIGMGLGVSASSRAVLARVVRGARGRFVIDADALGMLATLGENKAPCKCAEGQEFILTPHEGEAARLLGWERERVRADRNVAAWEIARRYGATVVLKGANTLVVSADGRRIYNNKTGNPFMALGGMGDLLSGVIGARWAYLKGDAFLAAAASVWLHGAASDSVVKDFRDPSIVNTAAAIGGIRVRFDT